MKTTLPTIHRRTFEAAKHPPGSPERVQLNLDPLTSEYMPSYRYLIREPARMSDGTPNPAQAFHNRTFRTKTEGQAYATLSR